MEALDRVWFFGFYWCLIWWEDVLDVCRRLVIFLRSQTKGWRREMHLKEVMNGKMEWYKERKAGEDAAKKKKSMLSR